MQLKVCSLCEKEKELTEYFRDSHGKLGRKARCKPCYSKTRTYTAETKENNRINKVKHRDRTLYNMHEERTVVFEQQLGRCKICEKKLKSPYHYTTHADHCHTTLKFRGLLCNHCNRLLGAAEDNIKVLEQAIKYLGCA